MVGDCSVANYDTDYDRWDANFLEYAGDVDIDYDRLEQKSTNIDLTYVTIDGQAIKLDMSFAVRTWVPDKERGMALMIEPNDPSNRGYAVKKALRSKIKPLFQDISDADGIGISLGAASFWHEVYIDKRVDQKRLAKIFAKRLRDAGIDDGGVETRPDW